MIKALFKKKIKLSAEAKAIISELLVFLLALIITPVRFAFGIYPFGIALCASTRRHTPFALVGAITSIVFFMDFNIVYLVAFLALLVLRLLASFLKKPDKSPLLGERRSKHIFKEIFEENVIFKVLIALSVSLGIGIYYVIINGYLFYDIFSLVFFICVSPILAYLFIGAFNGNTKSKAFLISIVAILFSLAYALSGKELGGIDFSIVISLALTLYVSKNSSTLYACVLGLVLGLAGEPSFAPVYALCALVAGLLWRVSSYLAIMCGFIVSMGYAIFVSGYEAIAYLAPEALGASLISYPILRFELIPRPAFLDANESSRESAKELDLKKQNEQSRHSLENMAHAFGDISKIFYDVSKRTRVPTRSELERTCLEACEAYCYSCPKEEICWKKDVPTTETSIKSMSENAFFLGKATKSTLDERFLHRCPNVDKIINRINKRTESFFEGGIKNDKLEISASSFELTSKILHSASTDGIEDEMKNKDLANTLSKRASLLGLVYDKIEVFGGRKKRILIVGVDTLRSGTLPSELCASFEEALKIKLSEPIISYADDTATIEINELPPYKITSKIASVPLDPSANGDSVLTFKNDFDKEYFLICDGMGSGESASITSGMCASFLEKLLSVTKEKEIAVSMLNNFVRAKNKECSSSIDLLEVDVACGEASFLKSGAAPSFIKRGSHVFKLSSKTAPIGIMKRLDSEKLSFTFMRGDICIMLSDGTLDGKKNQDASFIVSYLEENENTDPEKIANDIISLAREAGAKTDDMSVLALKFE